MSAHGDTVVGAATKLAPALTVGGATVAGFALQDWVLLLTGVYAVLQISLLVWDRFIKPWRARRGRK